MMRLGSRKRICFHTNRVSRRKCSVFLFIILITGLSCISLLYFLQTVRPVMTELAKSKTRYLANHIINTAVSEIFRSAPIKYSDIISLEKDSDGRIRAVQSDLAGVNSLKSEIALTVQQKISDISETALSIPMGSLSGIELLAGTGPYINVDLMPYGNTEVDFLSSFEAAGVNQTRLEVNLKVKTSVAVLIPTVNTGCDIETTVPLFQTLVVGEIPESFFNVDRADDALIDDAMELAP